MLITLLLYGNIRGLLSVVKAHLHSLYFFPQYSVRQGFVPAMNALAWYYEQYEQDYEQAVRLWEQADILECPDAALNLGVIYSQGRYPGKAADQVRLSITALSMLTD